MDPGAAFGVIRTPVGRNAPFSALSSPSALVPQTLVSAIVPRTLIATANTRDALRVGPFLIMLRLPSSFVVVFGNRRFYVQLIFPECGGSRKPQLRRVDER